MHNKIHQKKSGFICCFALWSTDCRVMSQSMTKVLTNNEPHTSDSSDSTKHPLKACRISWTNDEIEFNCFSFQSEDLQHNDTCLNSTDPTKCVCLVLSRDDVVPTKLIFICVNVSCISYNLDCTAAWARLLRYKIQRDIQRG